MTHSAAVLVLVSAALVCTLSSGASAGELAPGGDFESGGFPAGWVHGAGRIGGGQNPSWADHAVIMDLPFGGNYSALLGFKYTPQRKDRYGFMSLDVSIPLNISGAALYFKFRQQGYDGQGNDPFIVEIRDLSDNTLAAVVSYSFSETGDQFKDSGWIEDDGAGPAGFDMSAFAGQTVRLHFRQENRYNNLYETWTFIDDVSLVYGKFVDLAVDGNGDDQFGDPGTGAGGSSTHGMQTGATVAYVLDIENEGIDADSYILSVSPPAGWSAVISYGGADYSFPWTTPVLPPGSSMQAEVRLTVPAGEAVGSYATILDAVSTSFGNRFDSVTLETNVVPADHIADLAVDGDGFGVIDPFGGGGGASFRVVLPDTEVTYAVDLLNDGDSADSFLVWFVTANPLTAVMEEGAVVHSGPFTTGAVAAGDTSSFTLRVTVPPAAPFGDYVTLVYARSLTDTLKQDGIQAVTRVTAPGVDMIINGSGDDIVDPTGAGLGGSATLAGMRGSTVYFPVVLQNEGGVVDSFTLTWSKPKGGWEAVINDGAADHLFPWTTPPFAPASQRNYTLALTVPANSAYATYNSILEAVSNMDPTVRESVTASVSVTSGNEIDLIIDGNGDGTYGLMGSGLGGVSSVIANPGDTVTFTLTVENEGGEDLFDIQWNTPPGWEVVIGDSTSTMRGVPSGNYTIEVRVPASCAGGTFEIIVDGMKTNKKFLVDSVKGRVVVAYTHRVDALIDGAGDEMLGTPGLGDGGFSERAALAGTTIGFSLELQNQGGEAESYTVSWNLIPGWTAELDGSSPPYITAPINPGESALLAFDVTVPVGAAEGDYDYIIDLVSTIDGLNFESVTARIDVSAPGAVDLVADGNGAFDTAPAGSGEGGRALLFCDAGAMVTAALEVANRGAFPDSFRVAWIRPAGWAAGSVLLSDGSNDYASPFTTELIDPGSSVVYTVKIFVPAGADLRSSFVMDGFALSSDSEDSIILEISTAVLVAGYVFDDADHDGALDAGEAGFGGVVVTLTDPGGPLVAVTAGGGYYFYEVPAGPARDVIETTPAGMISLSPDTVSLGAASAGDTLLVNFAEVRGPAISPDCETNAPSGGFVEFPHTITAGTAGAAALSAALPAGWVEVFYRDNDGDGRLSPGDSPLAPADLDLDPAVPGRDVVPVIMRVFIPPQVPAGTVEVLKLTLDQVLSGTAITASDYVSDGVAVLAVASGLLDLVKEVDLSQARPGDVITYTIIFSNPGIENVQEIEIIDPVSSAVDIVTDAFGPGNDIAWIQGAVTVYLTADPADADEAMFEMPERRLRVDLSRQAPFALESGAEGRLVYMVRIK